MTDQKTPRRNGRPPLTDRATILNAALSTGYPDLTVGAVTKLVGVKYSTFYRHFPALADLVAACVDHDLQDVDWPVWTSDDVLENLADLGQALVVLGEQHPGIGAAVLRLTDHGEDPDEETGRGGEPARLRDERTAAELTLTAAGLDEVTAWAAVRGVVHDALAPAIGRTRRRDHRLNMISIRVDGIAARLDGKGR